MGKTETIHKGRVFDLNREEVRLPNGKTAVLDVIYHPGAAAMVPITADGKVLLLSQYRYAANGFIWEIPAGTLEPGEDMLDCAKRELIEETGFSADTWETLTTMTPVPGYSTEVIHMFLATGLSPAAQNLDEDEVLEVKTLDFTKALSMVETGEITDAKTICGLLLAGVKMGKVRMGG